MTFGPSGMAGARGIMQSGHCIVGAEPMKYRITLVFALLLLGGCFGINSDIEIGDGSSVDGDVESVNGSISLGANAAVAGHVTTVNGKITLGAGASAVEVAGVNGSVDIGEEARIEGSVEIVNGLVVLRAGSVVDQDVSSVNGQIRLEGATAGSVKNNNGGIVLERGSRVLGELRVEKSRFAKANDPVTVIIHADCEVTGPLVFERPVKLQIHESATVGEIQGAEPEYFSD